MLIVIRLSSDFIQLWKLWKCVFSVLSEAKHTLYLTGKIHINYIPKDTTEISEIFSLLDCGFHSFINVTK